MKQVLFLITFIIHVGSFAQQSDTLHFIWEGDSLGGQYFEKAAILIPVQVGSDTSTYYFQFDTGADASILYMGNAGGVSPTISLSADLMFETSLGKIRLDTLGYMSPFEEDGRTIIGTIGANVLESRTLVIDFPKQHLIFSESFDRNQFEIDSIEISYGRPTLVMQLGDAHYRFLFDTGSSTFELLATKPIWKKLGDKSSESKVMEISAWGKMCSTTTTKMKASVSVSACRSVHLNYVSYIDSKDFNKGFTGIGLNGLIGNKPFLNEVIVIDVSNKLFGVKCW